ncbi:MAG TPA: sigma-54 dependent transcriptional regulator, partial [Thermoanaerobaculia bacterium]|nr:sigma-54 dependent transcriptional regulator [Thermoanaerobaculia bacterium]
MSEQAPRHLLVVDDEPFFRQLVRRMLSEGGWSVLEASSSAEAWERLSNEPGIEGIFLDVVLGSENGLDFLKTYRERGGLVPVIVTTSLDDVETAVKAMKLGAYDFIVKPAAKERLATAVSHLAERRQLLLENRTLKRRVRESSFERMLVGESAAMRALFDEMERVVETEIPVCLLGETGSGKELVARWLHGHGPRSNGPFVDLNCAAIPETLIESELFGHEKGAFTGALARRVGKLEQADGGTLFFDELGEMAPATQARLLRVLEERALTRIGGSDRIPFDTRVISATQRDLSEEVRSGRFREDLYFRVVVYPIRIPPL